MIMFILKYSEPTWTLHEKGLEVERSNELPHIIDYLHSRGLSLDNCELYTEVSDDCSGGEESS